MRCNFSTKSEGNSILVKLRNVENIPRILSISSSTALIKSHTSKDDFKIMMLTRRTTLNPGETAKLRIDLPEPVTNYKDKAIFRLFIGDDGSCLNIMINRSMGTFEASV